MKTNFESLVQDEMPDAVIATMLAGEVVELRAPLKGIIGFSEFLIDEKPGQLSPRQKGIQVTFSTAPATCSNSRKSGIPLAS